MDKASSIREVHLLKRQLEGDWYLRRVINADQSFQVVKEFTVVAFIQDGQSIVASTRDGYLCRWRVEDKELMFVRKMVEREEYEFWPSFSANGERGVYGHHGQRRLVIFEVETGKVLTTSPSHECDLGYISISPDGSRVSFSDEKGRVWTWDVNPDQCFQELICRQKVFIHTVLFSSTLR